MKFDFYWPKVKKWGLALLSLIGVLLGAGWLWGKHKSKLGRLKDQVAVVEARKEMDKLRAVREEVASRVGEKDEIIDHIDRQLETNKRKIVEAYEHGEEMTDEEVRSAFSDLGY